MYWTTYRSPVGALTLIGSDDGLRTIRSCFHEPTLDRALVDPGAFSGTMRQLDLYFAGDIQKLDVPLDLDGTEFQRSIWNILIAIPYGRAITYEQLAAQLIDVAPGTAATVAALTRATALAVAKNPTPIVIPCHRTIGTEGTMRGYLGGIGRKESLLLFEAAGGDPLTLENRWAPPGKPYRASAYLHPSRHRRPPL